MQKDNLDKIQQLFMICSEPRREGKLLLIDVHQKPPINIILNGDVLEVFFLKSRMPPSQRPVNVLLEN